ncbi:hypothetical protein QBC35DRAFT_545339 [Podospora australis]|uniref:Uncharacterized protein n=1 Tax=Podospora australis TaxID=1536484 RepID=A0AAN6WIY3_9PEZI|nr:hypothetical protein QBC35DRAFT_545339 [Podospora australis]
MGGLVPEACATVTNRPEFSSSCPASSIEVYHARYSDIICRCGSSSDINSPGALAEGLGRIPPNARKEIRVLMNLKDPDNNNNDCYGFADWPTCGIFVVGNCWSHHQAAFIHEAAHVIDFKLHLGARVNYHGLDSFLGARTWSEGPIFTNATKANKCVVDNYAKTGTTASGRPGGIPCPCDREQGLIVSSWRIGYPDAFAQLAVVAVWNMYIGPFTEINELLWTTTGCLDHQLAATEDIFNRYFQRGATDCSLNTLEDVNYVRVNPETGAVSRPFHVKVSDLEKKPILI